MRTIFTLFLAVLTCLLGCANSVNNPHSIFPEVEEDTGEYVKLGENTLLLHFSFYLSLETGVQRLGKSLVSRALHFEDILTVEKIVEQALDLWDRTTGNCSDQMKIKLAVGLSSGKTLVATAIHARLGMPRHILERMGPESQKIWAHHEDGAGMLTKSDLLTLEQTYFGTLNATQQWKLDDVYLIAQRKLNTIKFHCPNNCNDEYAYTNKTHHNETIFICPKFAKEGASWWSIYNAVDPLRSIWDQQSQPITIIHEALHLTGRSGVGGMRDPEDRIVDHDLQGTGIMRANPKQFPPMHPCQDREPPPFCKVYGRRLAQQLAKSKTHLARTNADNYVFHVMDLNLGVLTGLPSLAGLHPLTVEEIQNARGYLPKDQLLEKEVLRRVQDMLSRRADMERMVASAGFLLEKDDRDEL